MYFVRGLIGSSVIALMASAGLAQVTNVGSNRSEVRDNGQGNEADVENGAQGSERNESLIIFNGDENRAEVDQIGLDNDSDMDVSGNSNDGDIRQLGFGNRGNLIQTGDRNSSAIDQYIDPSIGLYGGRFATVRQLGSQNSSSVTQVHWFNRAIVAQGSADGGASEGAISTIHQFSAENTATVTMVGGSIDAPNRSHIEQTRIDPIVTNNMATVNLAGSANLSNLQQIGVRNSAEHDARGNGNSISTRSFGNDMSVFVSQRGEDNSTTINQSPGERNVASVTQGSGAVGGDITNGQATIIQSGSNHRGSIFQFDSNNSGLLIQRGDGTDGSILQPLDSHIATLTLQGSSAGAPNRGMIQQDGRGGDGRQSIADMFIRGHDNVGELYQIGSAHQSWVSISGGAPRVGGGASLGNNFFLTQDSRLGSATTPGLAGHFAQVEVGGRPGTIESITRVQQIGAHATTANSAKIRQDGRLNRVILTQRIRSLEGNGGAFADISVGGENNFVSVLQGGHHRAFITQGFGQGNSIQATSFDSEGEQRNNQVGPVKGNNNIDSAQYGDRNRMTIVQEGSDSSATLWQKVGSSDNRILIDQGRLTFENSEGSNCQSGCQFAYDAAASVIQSGQFNVAAIAQYGTGGRAAIEQLGTGTSDLANEATIRQERSNAEALILQTVNVGPSTAGDPASGASGDPGYFAGGARRSIARIYQGDGAVDARIEQRGRGQQAFIDQRGANIASILQDVGATNATAIITQSGSGNNYSVTQTEPGQYINVTQTGTNNSVTNVISRP